MGYSGRVRRGMRARGAHGYGDGGPKRAELSVCGCTERRGEAKVDGEKGRRRARFGGVDKKRGGRKNDGQKERDKAPRASGPRASSRCSGGTHSDARADATTSFVRDGSQEGPSKPGTGEP